MLVAGSVVASVVAVSNREQAKVDSERPTFLTLGKIALNVSNLAVLPRQDDGSECRNCSQRNA